jgi:hypothetical protein
MSTWLSEVLALMSVVETIALSAIIATALVKTLMR